MYLDIINNNLLAVDLILCRDCFVHFSNKDILKSITNIKNSKSVYLLTTTFVNTKKDKNIPTEAWHGINLEQPPLNFPAPTKLFNEECSNMKYKDKSLRLWKIENL